MGDEDKIVGHKTFNDGHGGFRHEPLYENEAIQLIAAIDAAKEKRLADMPDERAAINALWQAQQRLKELGWNDAIYCPKDGSQFEVIELGSTGIHRCVYQGEWPKGTYWILENGDMSPSHPILFRTKETT